MKGGRKANTKQSLQLHVCGTEKKYAWLPLMLLVGWRRKDLEAKSIRVAEDLSYTAPAIPLEHLDAYKVS